MNADVALVDSGEWADLLDGLDRGVVRVSEGRIAAANGAFGRLAGLPAAELAGRGIGEVFADAGDRPLLALEPGDGFAVRDLSGRTRPVSLQRVSEALWLVVDRERESRLEREIWRLASEKRALPAQTSDAPLGGEQIGMIEHEIRTAVTAVRGYLRWLGSERDRLLEPEHWTFVREARRAIERVGPLLDNLLELARSGDPLPSARKPIRLHDVLELALRTARPLFADRGVQVECELGAVPDDLLGDADRLEQVFVNLLANAAAFSPEGARVRIVSDLAELDAGLVLQVAISDAGPGVARADTERLFRPFVRGPRPPGKGSSGVGLGLAICRRILNAHGGHIEAVPDLGYGLFRVTLPSEKSGTRP
jgi:signal transduction histidine kinase